MVDTKTTECIFPNQRKELKEKGHSLDYDQLKESLEILAKVDIEIQSEDKETQLFLVRLKR